MEIRAINLKEDLHQIVRLHIQAFPGFFMTEMGEAFIQEYYQAVFDFPENLSLVAIQNNEILGFVVGFGNPEAFYKFYRSRRWRLIPIIFRSIIRNPRLIGRVLENLKRVSSHTGDNSEVELSSIGVNPSLSGGGIGQYLIKAFVDVIRQRPYRSVYLTTDAEENERVNLFYVKQGFSLERTFLSGTRKMNQYRLFIEEL